ncbi:MAG: thioredoxin [Spirochaetes bacterium]|jgi:thioredoxin 1|nr:thioredoxin [Spirochaetota bacterium]
MGALMDLNGSNFDEAIKSNETILVDFWAVWCGPCRMQTPILEKLAQSGEIKAVIGKINTDDSPEIAQKFGISSIPTLILFKNGQETERFVGVQPESVLKAKLK